MLAALLFGAAFMIVLAAGADRLLSVSAETAEAESRLQASNLAAEGVELVKGWALTQTNADRQGGWRDKVAPLSGKYVAGYAAGGGYSLSPAGSEDVAGPGERAVTFTRTLEIRDGAAPGQKDVICTVTWGSRSAPVQYQTTITDA